MLRIPLDDAPAPHEAHARLAALHATTFVLESREGPERIARYSFVGFAPTGIVRLDADGLYVAGDLPSPTPDEAPLAYVRRVHAGHRMAADDADPQAPVDDAGPSAPFVGGLVGQLGFDFVRTLEPTLEAGATEDGPRLLLGLYLDGLVYDHAKGTCHYFSRGEDRSSSVLRAFDDPAPPHQDQLRIGAVQAETDSAAFVGQVEEAQRLIRAGECFQIVLGRAYRAPFEGSLTALYGRLRDEAAVPYLYHLRFEGTELLGASPESLVRVRGGRCETFPIAGTCPVTGDEDADARSAASLATDRKETAEHAMLVDLARNDLSRVSRPGTVRVTEYQSLQRFRTVAHLVSRVEGRLEDGRDALDALAAVFPAGTVSGAPKLRAIEHIDRIETSPRGPYAGAVAYFSFNGDLDAAITIRSLGASGGFLRVQAGAGIVHRSDPGAEFQETRHKAATMLDCLTAFGATLPDETAAPGDGPPPAAREVRT